MTISNERFAVLFLNWWEKTEKDFTLSDMEDICKDIGMTRSEFIELVSRSGEFIDKDGWTPEPKVNWAEETTADWSEETKEVNVGDTDQAILETALTQTGIPYGWEKSDDGDGGWIDLKIFDDGEATTNTAAEIYFTKEGKFRGLY